MLEAPSVYRFTDMSSVLTQRKPESTPWFTRRVNVELPEGDWGSVSLAERPYFIGKALGFTYGDVRSGSRASTQTQDLSPLSIIV